METEAHRQISPASRNEIANETAREASAAAIGALVGVAVGGAPGAVVGAAVAPFLSGSVKLASDLIQRRRRRAETIVASAMGRSGLTSTELVDRMQADQAKVDDFVAILSQVS